MNSTEQPDLSDETRPIEVESSDLSDTSDSSDPSDVSEPTEPAGSADPDDSAEFAEAAETADPDNSVQEEVVAQPVEPEELRGPIEAILLVVDEPLSTVTLAQVLEQPQPVVEETLRMLAADYDETGRGFELREVAGGWRYYTREEYAPVVERFVLDGQQAKLTQAALETLAVVAYKQPVSRSRVSAIRGVNCDGVMKTLVARGLVEEGGTEEESGATLFRTTSYFLERLGLGTLDELPDLAPFLPEISELEGMEGVGGPVSIEAVADMSGVEVVETEPPADQAAGESEPGDDAGPGESSEAEEPSDLDDEDEPTDEPGPDDEGRPGDLDEPIDQDEGGVVDQDEPVDQSEAAEPDHAYGAGFAR